jgi:hypothetical protein
VDTRPCLNVTLVTKHLNLTCSLPAGYGSQLTVTVNVLGGVGSKSSALSYACKFHLLRIAPFFKV